MDEYRLIERAIGLISKKGIAPVFLEETSQNIDLPAPEAYELSTRWVGVSPRAFFEAKVTGQARVSISEGSTCLDSLSGLYHSGSRGSADMFIQYEIQFLESFGNKGKSLRIDYGFHTSPFGMACVLVAEGNLLALSFFDKGNQISSLSELQRRWPEALYSQNDVATKSYLDRIFCRDKWRPQEPLRIALRGSAFELRVWSALLDIPFGKVASYSGIAEKLGNPRASRAAASAIGRNPIAFVIPCHRVISKSGSLGGYHWGLARKRAMLAWEAAVKL